VPSPPSRLRVARARLIVHADRAPSHGAPAREYLCGLLSDRLIIAISGRRSFRQATLDSVALVPEAAVIFGLPSV
jgi:hypothetical protein